MKSVLPYFTPTEVIMIDDDVSILKEGNLKLKSLPVISHPFENPFEALDYINSSSKKSAEIMDLNALHRQIFSPNRFMQISTIIVDYDMPGMNGLELCRQVTSPYIQKIMLTGAATNQIAVDAFNEGLIDQFIQKNDPEVFAKLQSAIVKAQEKYFDMTTSDLVNQLLLEYPETEVLKDPAFVDFFENFVQENQVTEHYLLDAMGSFLFLSETGEASALFVFNEETLEFQEDMIPETDRNTDLAKEIYTQQKAICFYPFNTLEKYDPQNWKNYIQPLTQLKGNTAVFTAFVSDLTTLDQSKIVSFKNYLTKAEK